MRRYIYILGSLLFVFGLTTAQEGAGTIQLAQWATGADATSEYTDSAWSADRATGAPDVLACEDNANSWASASAGTQETLTLTYDTAVTPTQINIYQNYNSGTITSVALVPVGGGDVIPIRNSADPGGTCPTVFSLDLPGGLPETREIIISLDQSDLGDWNEIDAVELVGTTTGFPADSEPSSLDIDDFPQYNLVTTGGGGDENVVVPPSDTNGNGGGNAQQANDNTAMPDFGGEWGTSVSCPTGETITNGIDITIVQQRPGSNYRMTAIGINGFDPVIAVRDEFGNIICNDDSADALSYSANLPTTGQVPTGNTNSQVLYSVRGNNFANITITVGGFGGTGGEFVLIVEGMIATSADGAGDPFSLYASPALLMSGVDPTAYMVSVVGAFDPILSVIDGDYNVVGDANGNPIVCDDAGSQGLCWTTGTRLIGSYVSRSQNRQLAGGRFDALLTYPLNGNWGGYINYLMAGTRNTQGDYVAAFHLGTAEQP